MKTKHWSATLTKLGACKEAVAWARRQPSLRVAWSTCNRPDWMTWLLWQGPAKKPSTKKMDALFAKLDRIVWWKQDRVERANIVRRYFPRPPRLDAGKR